jgi:molybdenum cofactor cytidylyltransferase
MWMARTSAAERLALAAIVLAAGTGSRYSDQPGAKLVAALDGRPLLEHVLLAVRAFGPAVTITVLGHGADAIEGSIGWVSERRVTNPAPERGLASSIQVGVSALGATDLDGVFIVLGDQPRLRVEVMEALVAGAGEDASWIVVPRYVDHPGPRNPVLLMRPAWPLIDRLTGDQGLGALIDTRPELVRIVEVEGRMPDVDRPVDLAAMDGDSIECRP